MKILEDKRQLSPLPLEMQLQIKDWKLLLQTSRSIVMVQQRATYFFNSSLIYSNTVFATAILLY